MEKVAGMDPQEIAAMAKMFMENKEEVKALVQVFSPVVTETLELAMDTIGPEIERVSLRVGLGIVGIRKAVFDKYISLDFTREETLALMLNDIANSQKLGDAVNNSVKTSK